MDINKKYFSNLTLRERAIFEGGISMGALFHQFVGTPVNEKTKKSLEKAIEEAIKLQPAIEKAKVDINLKNLKSSEFEYISLSGEMLNVFIQSKIENIIVNIKMEFIEELNYPLMYVED